MIGGVNGRIFRTALTDLMILTILRTLMMLTILRTLTTVTTLIYYCDHNDTVIGVCGPGYPIDLVCSQNSEVSPAFLELGAR